MFSFLNETINSISKKAIEEVVHDRAENLRKVLIFYKPDGKNFLFTSLEFQTGKENKIGFSGKVSESYSTKNVQFLVEAFINGGMIKDRLGKSIIIGPNRNYDIEVNIPAG